MKLLVLGGTAWLGGTITRLALEAGHDVTCLARGQAGGVPDGARLVAADRGAPAAYDDVAGQDWDEVVDVSWQPDFVRSALDRLADRAAHWSYVSSCSVYADHSTPGADETAELLPAWSGPGVAGRDVYGEAKVACEQLCQHAVGDRLLIARSGLIGGPGDISDRTGAWPARFARAVVDGGPVLVPDDPDCPVQMIDARDLAAWLVDCAEVGQVATVNASGSVGRFDDFINLARFEAGHTGAVTRVDPEWLLAQGVEEFMGPESLALWLHSPEAMGFSARDVSAAASTGRRGLVARPWEQTVADVLAWERGQGLDRPRKAGLSSGREAELLAGWASH